MVGANASVSLVTEYKYSSNHPLSITINLINQFKILSLITQLIINVISEINQR